MREDLPRTRGAFSLVLVFLSYSTTVQVADRSRFAFYSTTCESYRRSKGRSNTEAERRDAPAEPEEARDVHVHRRVYRTMYIVDVAYYYERGDRLQFLGASKKDTMKEKGVSF